MKAAVVAVVTTAKSIQMIIGPEAIARPTVCTIDTPNIDPDQLSLI
ncbi:hypothetical protein [Rhizobium leguminosarum]|nr:hypothetical protein [Rhizobium leguminosarum]